jgi:hypothetical protein
MICVVFAAMSSGLPSGLAFLCYAHSGSNSRSEVMFETSSFTAIDSNCVGSRIFSIILDGNCARKEAVLHLSSEQQFEEAGRSRRSFERSLKGRILSPPFSICLARIAVCLFADQLATSSSD